MAKDATPSEGAAVWRKNKMKSHLHHTLIDICLDEQTGTILAFNDYNNLLFFDLKGNFIKREKCKKLYENIIYNNGSVLFYNPGEGYSCYPYHIEKFNLKEKTWEIIGKEKKLDFPMRLYGKHIIKSKRIWFGTPLDFDLNLFYNSKIESKYKLVPATDLLTKDEMKLATTDYYKFSTVRETKMYGIGAIRETAHYLIFRSSKAGFFILNKETNEIHWEDFVDEASLGIKLVNYFPHDGDDNRIMFLVSPIEWLNRKKMRIIIFQ